MEYCAFILSVAVIGLSHYLMTLIEYCAFILSVDVIGLSHHLMNLMRISNLIKKVQ